MADNLQDLHINLGDPKHPIRSIHRVFGDPSTHYPFNKLRLSVSTQNIKQTLETRSHHNSSTMNQSIEAMEPHSTEHDRSLRRFSARLQY